MDSRPQALSRPAFTARRCRSLVAAGLASAALAVSAGHARAVVWLSAVCAGTLEGVVSVHALGELWSMLTKLPVSPPISPPIPRWLALCAPLFLAAIACTPSAPTAPPTPNSSATAAAPPAAPIPPSLASAAPELPGPPLRLLVASDKGLREVGSDGASIRVLSTTPSQHPRFAAEGGDELLFYAPALGEVRRLSLTKGLEVSVARLPSTFKTCGQLPDYPRGHTFALADLSIQQDEDFVVDAAAKAICFRLGDRNDSMANVKIEGRVDLRTGVVAHRVAIGGDCGKKRTAIPACVAAEPPRAARPKDPFPLASLGIASTVDEETVAPSGRWSVLAQPTPGGDYIHRSLFLLDRHAQHVYPLAPGPFPSPLGAVERAALGDFKGTLDAVGESSVRWLGRDDTLLVDGLLVIPGRQAVELHGDVAR